MSLSGYWKEREGRTRRDGGSRRAQMCPSPGMLMPTRYLLVAGLRGYCDTSPKRENITCLGAEGQRETGLRST